MSRLALPRVATFAVVATALVLASGSALAQTSSPDAGSGSPTEPSSPAGPGSPAPRPGAQVGRTEDQVVLSGTATIPRGHAVGEVVVFHGRANVAGVVVGDVVVLNGAVSISGQVSGSVVAMNGPIRLAATATVGGDVLGAGTVRVAPGARVDGEVRDDVRFTPRGAFAVLGALLGGVSIAVSALLVLVLVAALAPRGLDRVATAARTAPFASIGWGLAVVVVVPIVAVAAAASILALPFGLSLLLALGLLGLAGYAFAVYAVGRLLVPEPRGRPSALAAGWGLGAALGLVPFLNVVVWALGSAFGLGAAVVATWRVRRGVPTRGRHRAGHVAHAPAKAEPPKEPAPVPASGSPDREVPAASEVPTASESYPATADD
jgi:hypothetical protein